MLKNNPYVHIFYNQLQVMQTDCMRIGMVIENFEKEVLVYLMKELSWLQEFLHREKWCLNDESLNLSATKRSLCHNHISNKRMLWIQKPYLCSKNILSQMSQCYKKSDFW